MLEKEMKKGKKIFDKYRREVGTNLFPLLYTRAMIDFIEENYKK